MPPLRVACLGAGYFSRFHYDAWSRIPDAMPVGSADRDLEKARATGLPAFDSLAEMMEAARPDIVDVITPPPTHLEAIETAVSGGARAVICQKPFCRDMSEAERAVGIAKRAGVALIVHENFRFQPWYRAIKAAMDDGAVGQVHQVTFRLRTGDGQGPEAYLDRQPYFQKMPRLLVHETAVHWLDVFRYLLGEPDEVYADLRRMNPVIAGEDAGHVILGYENGARAVFDGDRHLDHAAKDLRRTLGECLVEGTGGTLTLTGDGAVSLRRFGEVEARVILAARDWPGFAGDCVHALQTHVVHSLLHGKEFENSAEDYLPVLRLEEAVYRSAEEGRKIHV